VTDVAYGRGAFVIATPGALYRRPLGSTSWQKTAYTGTGDINNLAITDSLYVTPGAWSADGVTWTKSQNSPPAITKLLSTTGP